MQRMSKLVAGALIAGLAAAGWTLVAAGPATAANCAYKSYKDWGDEAYAAVSLGCLESSTKARYQLTATGNTVWNSYPGFDVYVVQGYLVSYSYGVGSANEVTGGQTRVEYSNTAAPISYLPIVSH